MRGTCLGLPALCLTVACGARQGDPRPPVQRGEATEVGVEEPTAPTAKAVEPGATPLRAGSQPPLLVDDREPDPAHALPRLTTRHIGMHIGGESNSPEAKAPLLAALDRGELAFLHCYRLVDQPLRGGTFGADLYLPARGGAPEVRATRQKLGGQEFDACMRDALLELSFPALPRPTMVSYSLRFDISP